jgi:glycosyltransferase involved in cell wall biosynthesis
MNADVRAANINPFYHYVAFGRGEGRTAQPSIVRRFQPVPGSASVLFVCHAGQFTGAEVMLRDVIEWFANNTTYHITVLALEYGPIFEHYAKFAHVIVINGIEDIAFAVKHGLCDRKYDYIYCNTIVSGDFGEVYSNLFGTSRPPLIMHVHEMKETIALYRNNFERIRPYISQYIGASQRVKEDLTTYFDVDADQISVFESFIRISAQSTKDISIMRRDARMQLDLPDDAFVVLGAGSVYPRKAPDIFVETLKILLDRSSHQNVIAVWLGNGPDYQAICDWTSRIGLQDRIRFVGHKSNARELIAAADIFFLPSREDPFPLVCLEAAQYAIPTVYFKGHSGIDTFTQEDAGFGVESFSAETAASTIEMLIARRASLDDAGLNARLRVLRKNSQTAVMPILFNKLRTDYRIDPSLSVIIPNYNHERFLPERIGSVLAQDFMDMDVIILDDLSTDNSLSVIERHTHDPRISVHPNSIRSGSPFLQWKKGLSLARSSYVWIAESDDSCTTNFIEHVFASFVKNDINISYCKTININENGERTTTTLDNYLKAAAGNKFETSYDKDGREEVESSMGFTCTIVNASAAIMRKSALERAIGLADDFKMCGDWIIYLDMLRSGGISYTVEASNFFRRHAGSVVSILEGSDIYFDERERIARYVVRNFYLPVKTTSRIVHELEKEWDRFAHIPKVGTKQLLSKNLRLGSGPSKDRRHLAHIAFYVHGMMFSRGGIERQAASIANHLSRLGHTVFVFCRVSDSKVCPYELDERVSVIPVFDEGSLTSAVAALRAMLVDHGIEIFIPMLSEWLFEPVVAAADGLDILRIVSEHNDPSVIEAQWWDRSGRLRCFDKADAVHLLLEKFKASLTDTIAARSVIIPNGVSPDVRGFADLSSVKRRIIAVGRLAKQKNFLALIRAFAIVTPDHPNWELAIFGEGSERQILQDEIDRLRLVGRVRLNGETTAIHDEMIASDFLVVPSLFEGFAIVVVEAKRAGLPAIAYASCNGPNELIRDAVDGVLVRSDAEEDLDGRALADAIARMIVDGERRIAMGAEALKSFSDYDIGKIAEQWENLINRLMLEKLARNIYRHTPFQAKGMVDPETTKNSKLVAMAG